MNLNVFTDFFERSSKLLLEIKSLKKKKNKRKSLIILVVDVKN